MRALTVNNNGHHVIVTIVWRSSYSTITLSIFVIHFISLSLLQKVEPEELIDDYWPFESRKSTVKNMGEASKDVNTYMMGVSGMGGVGKNTFVNEVGRKAMKISYLRGGFRRGMMIISQIFFC
ncbi:hypothetical protein Pint_21612 [Pistacia integerrima]|uniref:Uncharacterized protein n=1 Tax=Pistacia integerrima TaxID=434235 RepID=A0ACC0X869_9ROSI|nr:hypothetical protein Pint_21612 [Pistacia integerrima]